MVGGASKGPKAGPYKGRGFLRKGGAPPTGEELRRKGRSLEWGGAYTGRGIRTGGGAWLLAPVPLPRLRVSP